MKAIVRFSVLAVFALSLAACGGDDGEAAAPVAAKPAATAPADPAPVVDTKATDGKQPQPPHRGAMQPKVEAASESAAASARRQPRREWRESLSEAQRSGIQALRQRTAGQMGAVREEQRTAQASFHEALVSGDRDAVLAASEQLAELAATAERLRLEEMIELSGLLSPEQREQMPVQLRQGTVRAGRFGEGRRRAAPTDATD